MAQRKDKNEHESPREEKKTERSSSQGPARSNGGAGTKPRQAPARSPDKPLPRWRVILHNDDINYADDVVQSIVMITPLKEAEAQLKTKLAHQSGTALLLTTHRERAELYVQQFASKHLTVTAEPEK